MSVKNKDIRGFITFQSKNIIGEIGLFPVEEAYRHRGTGKSLLQAAIEAAQSDGLESLEMATQKDNVPAMAL